MLLLGSFYRSTMSTSFKEYFDIWKFYCSFAMEYRMIATGVNSVTPTDYRYII